ncbi:uncharacterized protein RJT20DRAFT_131131 [Scheffersomyces xylosifermentans]|uniref:uncharacterized protein n=1 Tax=Scheffersomyces xylosifermentans TaxID=1304137 RepID=UPI00315C5DCE
MVTSDILSMTVDLPDSGMLVSTQVPSSASESNDIITTTIIETGVDGIVTTYTTTLVLTQTVTECDTSAVTVTGPYGKVSTYTTSRSYSDVENGDSEPESQYAESELNTGANIGTSDISNLVSPSEINDANASSNTASVSDTSSTSIATADTSKSEPTSASISSAESGVSGDASPAINTYEGSSNKLLPAISLPFAFIICLISIYV